METETTILLEALAVAMALVALAIYATLENTLARMTRVDVKLLLDRRREHAADRVIGALAKGKYQVMIPLQFFLQLLLVTLGLLVFLLLDHFRLPYPFPATILTLALLIFVLRHWIPWALAENEPERVFLRLLPFLRPVYHLFRLPCHPAIVLAARRQLSPADPEDGDEDISEEEVQAFLDVGEEEGIFEQAESRIIQQVVEFGDTIVREIMAPRTEMVAIRHNATKEELKNLMVQSRHSRIPVYRDRIDAVVGVVYVRQLLAKYSSESLAEPIDDIVMPAFFIPETKKVSELLREMQNRGEHMAIVVDEYGGVAGLVTLEDLLEEIVGEIRDEDQPEEIAIHREGDDVYVMDGDTGLDEIGQALGVDLYEDGYNTIAGIVIKQLGRFPVPDETIVLKGLQIQVLDVDSRKIRRVRIRRLPGNES